jgi:hypothetical protein
MILTHLNSADEYIWNELLLVYYNLFAQWTYQFGQFTSCISYFYLRYSSARITCILLENYNKIFSFILISGTFF